MVKDIHYSPDQLDDLLPVYYKKLFPSELFCRWLSYGSTAKQYFSFREFSFTLKDDVYIRYQSFEDMNEFCKELRRMLPHKIDIGAVYNHRPKNHKTLKSAAFQPLSKELVFDIDMTDYDDVRFCCSEADVCCKCWPLMHMAVKVLDRSLREDFGFQHILWVYSGRRGIHCWVCDEAARKLSPMARSSIAEYLTLVKGGGSQSKKVNLKDNSKQDRMTQHPSVEAAVNIIAPLFSSYAVDKQDFLADTDRAEKILRLLPADMSDELSQCWGKSSGGSSKVKWRTLSKFLSEQNPTLLKEVMLQYTYPRLDVNVTTGLNHLLKSPFCVHPKTGRVCIPFNASKVEQFDPDTVPTVAQLIEELNNESVKNLHDYKRTSMRQAVELFEEFVGNLEAEVKGRRLEESDKMLIF